MFVIIITFFRSFFDYFCRSFSIYCFYLFLTFLLSWFLAFCLSCCLSHVFLSFVLSSFLSLSLSLSSFGSFFIFLCFSASVVFLSVVVYLFPSPSFLSSVAFLCAAPPPPPPPSQNKKARSHAPSHTRADAGACQHRIGQEACSGLRQCCCLHACRCLLRLCCRMIATLLYVVL